MAERDELIETPFSIFWNYERLLAVRCTVAFLQLGEQTSLSQFQFETVIKNKRVPVADINNT